MSTTQKNKIAKHKNCCFFSRPLSKNHVKYYAQPAATNPIKEKNQTPAVWPKRDRRLLQHGSQVHSLLSLPRTLNACRCEHSTKRPARKNCQDCTHPPTAQNLIKEQSKAETNCSTVGFYFCMKNF